MKVVVQRQSDSGHSMGVAISSKFLESILEEFFTLRMAVM